MLAPREAAFLLLHLALQPWLGAGAQATPQGKWARAETGTESPGLLFRALLRRQEGPAPRALLGPRFPGASIGTSLNPLGSESQYLVTVFSENPLSSDEPSSKLCSACKEVEFISELSTRR